MIAGVFPHVSSSGHVRYMTIGWKHIHRIYPEIEYTQVRTDRVELAGDGVVRGNPGYQSGSDAPLRPGKLFQAFAPAQLNVLAELEVALTVMQRWVEVEATGKRLPGNFKQYIVDSYVSEHVTHKLCIHILLTTPFLLEGSKLNIQGQPAKTAC